MLLGLRTVVYKVSDLASAKEWYSRIFGIMPYFDEPFYVGFNVGGFELGLDPDVSGQSAEAGGSTAYWGVASIADTLQQLAEQGVTVIVPLQDTGDDIRLATVSDPFGNLIGLIENPHFTI